MIYYESTKDCGYETRTARIFVNPSNYLVYIEGSHNIYERDVETFEEAVALVKRDGFDEPVLEGIY